MTMKKNNSGVSLLEALISMVIVGIGFVAVLQITQYSINSDIKTPATGAFLY